ncbi:hypothetical protein [Rhodophyticola sp.]|uniref:hypothetical protein n=1 Tax=Rhodophyticola sp. TaxID=2680032 RepID=UPI003D2B52D8
MPTGAVIERGAGADGSHVRFADDTRICNVTAAAQARDAAVGALFGLVRACIRAVAVDGGRALDLVLIA